MKFNLVLNKDAEEEVTAVVHERTPMIDTIEQIVSSDGVPDELYGHVDLRIIFDTLTIDIPNTYKEITSSSK